MRKFELFQVDITSHYAELSLSKYFHLTKEEDADLLDHMLEWVSNMVSEMKPEAAKQLSSWTDEERKEFLSVARERLEKLLSSWEEDAYMENIHVGRLQLLYSKVRKTLVLGYRFPRLCIYEIEHED